MLLEKILEILQVYQEETRKQSLVDVTEAMLQAFETTDVMNALATCLETRYQDNEITSALEEILKKIEASQLGTQQ
ncbi:MAG: hypothetical protein HC815_19560 [Richelia sp. RM1_1_1]|nr:hypothetical protein [Richelia sp. RM1_1_1]